MLYIKTIITSLLFCIVFSIGAGTPPKGEVKTQDTFLIFRQIKKRTDRPKAPSLQVIKCEYDGVYLIFSFVIPEGECELAIFDCAANDEKNYYFDSSDGYVEIHVGQLNESVLTLSTGLGNIYTADLISE